MIGLSKTSRLLRLLGDETRLRMLNLLAQEELTGSELMEILNLGQSRISTQLGSLREAGLVVDRRAGRRSYYRIAPSSASMLLELVQADNRRCPEFEKDLSELEILRARKRDEARSYFDRVAADFDGALLPGRTWEGLARALCLLAPRGRYADIGVGDGLLTLMLSEIADSVKAIDISAAMLGQLRSRAASKGIQNIETIEGDMESLPLSDASQDVVVLSQALHYARVPRTALSEAHRILDQDGKLLVLDLLAHTEEWVIPKHQHVHLGFTETGLKSMIESSGFRDVRVERAARDPQPPHFMTLIATGIRA